MHLECSNYGRVLVTKQRSLHLAIEKLEAGTKAARLRALMPEIEQRLAAGARISDLVRTLNDNGLPMSTATLKSYLYRFRKAAREESPQGAWVLAQDVDRDALLSSPSFETNDDITESRVSDAATTTPGLLRHINTARCLRLLRRGSRFSRAELARELN